MAETEAEIAALRTAVREAHEALKDLRTATREAKAATAELRAAAAVACDERIDPVVRESLEDWSRQSLKFIGDAEQRIYARFDTIANIMLGEHKSSRRRGEPSLRDYASRIAEGAG